MRAPRNMDQPKTPTSRLFVTTAVENRDEIEEVKRQNRNVIYRPCDGRPLLWIALTSPARMTRGPFEFYLLRTTNNLFYTILHLSPQSITSTFTTNTSQYFLQLSFLESPIKGPMPHHNYSHLLQSTSSEIVFLKCQFKWFFVVDEVT